VTAAGDRKESQHEISTLWKKPRQRSPRLFAAFLLLSLGFLAFVAWTSRTGGGSRRPPIRLAGAGAGRLRDLRSLAPIITAAVARAVRAAKSAGRRLAEVAAAIAVGAAMVFGALMFFAWFFYRAGAAHRSRHAGDHDGCGGDLAPPAVNVKATLLC